MDSFATHLPPVGSSAIDSNAPKAKKAKPAQGTTQGPPVETEDRAMRFDRFDKSKAGKLSREEYLSTQSNTTAADDRFEKWDTEYGRISCHAMSSSKWGRNRVERLPSTIPDWQSLLDCFDGLGPVERPETNCRLANTE